MKRLLLTAGEPAGIGPELLVRAAQSTCPAERVLVADPDLMRQRAKALGLPLTLHETELSTPAAGPSRSGELGIVPVKLARASIPGRLDPDNAGYVVATLNRAADIMQAGGADALVTAPVHKGIINEGAFAFIGHTEFFAERAGVSRVVMMLAVPDLRVALVTTHLPLAKVPAAITASVLEQTLLILDQALRRDFAISMPRISVLGLNPHAGEAGHLGREEIDIIIPVMQSMRERGLHLVGPLPADTAFTPRSLAGIDAVLAMYHDQGLPVLKARGFGNAVNITLGLPWIRTSVDHGTALDLAGTGRAEASSLQAAIECALDLAERHEHSHE